MSFEENRANQIVSRINGDRNILTLSSIGNGHVPEDGSKVFEIKSSARLEEISGLWSWIATIKIITDKVILREERTISEDYWEYDIELMCHYLLKNVILRGLFVQETRG